MTTWPSLTHQFVCLHWLASWWTTAMVTDTWTSINTRTSLMLCQYLVLVFIFVLIFQSTVWIWCLYSVQMYRDAAGSDITCGPARPGTPIQTGRCSGMGARTRPEQTPRWTTGHCGPRCCRQPPRWAGPLRKASGAGTLRSEKQNHQHSKVPTNRFLHWCAVVRPVGCRLTLLSPSMLCSSWRWASATSRPPLCSSFGRKCLRVEVQWRFQRVGWRGRHSIIFSFSIFSILPRQKNKVRVEVDKKN